MPACCLFGCSFAMAVCSLLQSLGRSVHACSLRNSAWVMWSRWCMRRVQLLSATLAAGAVLLLNRYNSGGGSCLFCLPMSCESRNLHVVNVRDSLCENVISCIWLCPFKVYMLERIAAISLCTDTEWCSWFAWGIGYCPEGPWQAWGVGLCEPHGVQQGQGQGPAPWVGATCNISVGWRLSALKNWVWGSNVYLQPRKPVISSHSQWYKTGTDLLERVQRSPQKWSEGWNTSPVRKGWDSWGCSAWKRGVFGETLFWCFST